MIFEARNLPAFEMVNLSAALDWYTSNYGYQKCLLLAGTQRLDLDGKPVARVTETEARAAQIEVDNINSKKTVIRLPQSAQNRN